MKPYNLTGMIYPIFTIVAGVLGGAVAFSLYTWDFPILNDSAGNLFVHAGAFTAWFFIQVILFAFITILIIPAWVICYRLIRYANHYSEIPYWRMILGLLTYSVCLAVTVVSIDLFSIQYPGKFVYHQWPMGLTERFQAGYAYATLAFLPVTCSMIIFNYIAAGMSKKIQTISKSEAKTIEFIKDYLGLRRLLQILLLAMGFILSLFPLIIAGLRKILLEINFRTEANSPIESVISYGLILSALLILIYAPSYLNFTNVGRELRDHLYPIQSLDNLKDVRTKREELDLLLQTNVGITQNLKAGIVVLAPLASALLISLLGIKIGP